MECVSLFLFLISFSAFSHSSHSSFLTFLCLSHFLTICGHSKSHTKSSNTDVILSSKLVSFSKRTWRLLSFFHRMPLLESHLLKKYHWINRHQKGALFWAKNLEQNKLKPLGMPQHFIKFATPYSAYKLAYRCFLKGELIWTWFKV